MTRRPIRARSAPTPPHSGPQASPPDPAATPQHPDLEYCPTVPELERQGLATVVARNSKLDPTHYQLTPAGEQLLAGIMRRNGQRLQDPDLRRRVQDWAVAHPRPSG